MGKDVIRVHISHMLSWEEDIEESYRIVAELTTKFFEEFEEMPAVGDKR
jgi:hypothetical protein